MMYQRLYLYCDGASRGNPGPSGIGVLIIDSEGRTVERLGEFVGRRTNNQAEYEALIRGLEHSSRLTDREVSCFMDSELVVRQLGREYEVRAPGLRKLFRRVEELEKRFGRVEYRHLPRDDDRMKLVDQLANQAIEGRTTRKAGLSGGEDRAS
ncbi:MAG: ribonuclease HI family protein [Candidatus Geothermarchaeales archaeon]